MICKLNRGPRLRAAYILLAVFFALSESGNAQPVLTKIQDMVYLADGTRFNGLAFIDWKSFDAPNGAVIGQNAKVVRIVDGLLKVQLAPTTLTNKVYYSVKYSSGGRILFTEIWAVSPNVATLKLRDVRAVLLPGGFVSAPNNSGGTSGGGGLVIGENGTGAFVDEEIPAGLINGTNTVFTIAGTPNPAASLKIIRNGIQLSSSIDYTLTGTTISFVSGAQPQTGDLLRASYRSGIFGTAPHNLLSDLHTDTLSEAVVRGDLIVSQGTTTKWMRLPLGAANRCLISNGQDAVWNACLFTGFTAGAVPFVDSSSVLAQDLGSFFWDAANRRLGLGTSVPSANLTIQASGTQGASNLTRWLAADGITELGRVQSDGTLSVQRMTVSSNGTRAALNDSGFGSDPASPVSGDFWFNNSQRARKSYEAGQVHAFPQVLCSVGGGQTSSTTATSIGTCSIPGFFFDSGDRIEIALNLEHAGSASAFTVDIFVGAASVFSRSFAATDTLAFVRSSGGYYPTGSAFGTYSFGTAGGSAGSAFAGLSGNVSLVPTTAAVISFRARLNTASADTVTLRNFSVIRYPAQFNP